MELAEVRGCHMQAGTEAGPSTIITLNCGAIIDRQATIDEMGESIFKLILETASGQPSKSETFGFGDHEFVTWHIGAIL
jgi:altronate dehydratase